MSDRSSTAPNSGSTPGELLASVTALQRRTRAVRNAYWLPLLLFGLLMAAAAPCTPSRPIRSACVSGRTTLL